MLKYKRFSALQLVGMLVFLSPANAAIIDFSGSHGDAFYFDLNQDGTADAGIDGTGLLPGVTVSVSNYNQNFDLGVIFDTLFSGSTSDPDLLGPPWSGGGNLAGSAPIGGIAIIQENIGAFNPPTNSTVSDPDDEGGRAAGEFRFEFSKAITSFGFDIVDVAISFADFMARDGTVSFGNNSLNRIIPLTNAEFTTGPWDSVTIVLGGSGGIDNVVFTTSTPEPSTIAIWSLLGLGGMAINRRRRRRSA
jgi:hypothetical protein